MITSVVVKIVPKCQHQKLASHTFNQHVYIINVNLYWSHLAHPLGILITLRHEVSDGKQRSKFKFKLYNALFLLQFFCDSIGRYRVIISGDIFTIPRLHSLVIWWTDQAIVASKMVCCSTASISASKYHLM